MANDTFQQIWNKVLLYGPNIPVPLAREFVKNAYNQAVDSHYFSELRQDAEFFVNTAYTTGSVAATNGSATLTGTGTTFTSAMTNRQIMLDNIGPMYTITYVSGTEVTLDRNYEGADDSEMSFEIGNYYVDFPTDLRNLEKVRDQQNGWYLASEWFTQEYLDRVDSKRNSSGTPTMLVTAPPRTDGSGNVIPRYEMWPRSTTARLYQYRYVKRFTELTNTVRIIDALHAETVLYGALRLAALWPGTPDSPNNLFGAEQHAQFTKIYEEYLQDDTMNDIDRHQTMVSIADDVPRRFPFDAKYLQEHIW